MKDGRTSTPVRLPTRDASPSRILATRVGIAVGLVLIVAAITYAGRDGYRDSAGDEVGALDAVYYATVSITTTGYGDIVPVSDGARLATTLLVTPARVIFLILLVGTTLELLAERTRAAIRERIWRSRLGDHIIVCGYGTKGKTAIQALVGKGHSKERVVVIDPRVEAVEQATTDGFAAVGGNAEQGATLHHAGIESARAVIVAPDRDDTAVLITLTARELNPGATIVSAVRETENAHLLRQSGANSVITTSAAAGRLLGLATDTPRLVEVLEDLLSVGEGLDLIEREIGPEDEGLQRDLRGSDLLVAVVRGEELLRFDDPEAERLVAGDRVLCLCSHDDEPAKKRPDQDSNLGPTP